MQPLPSKPIPFLFSFLSSKERKWIFALSVGEILRAGNFVLRPYMVKLSLDRLSTLDALSPSVFFPIFSYIFLNILDNVYYVGIDQLATKFYARLRGNVTERVTHYVSHHSYAYFQEKFSGNLAAKIKDTGKGCVEVLRFGMESLFSGSITLLLSSLILARLHLSLFFLLWSWALLFLSFSFVKTKVSQALAYRFSRAGSRVMGTIVDLLGNILSVHLFAQHEEEIKRLRGDIDRSIWREEKWKFYLRKIASMQNLMTTLMMTLSLLLLVWLKGQGMQSVGNFGLLFLLTDQIAQKIRELAEKAHRASEYFGLLSQGISILSVPHEIKEHSAAKPLLISEGEILFDSVSFCYPSSPPLFLKKSITIAGGEKVGLVGHSGSGKSTFLHLIPRLYDLQRGSIQIDGQNLANCSLNSLRRQISILPQEPSLFHRSIRENILYGKREATEEELLRATKRAHAHDFITRLPQGYNSLVGERGIKLSGGERQRIAIARALLKNAKILLLDEPTSNLDLPTEQSIQEIFLSLMEEKTVLVIAHRLTTLSFMDRILVFEGGEIVEEGKHEELFSKGNFYTKLWNAQLKGIRESLDL